LPDAPALARVAQAAFSETFNHYEPAALQAYLDAHCGEAFFVRALSDPETIVWIAELKGRAVGYAKAGAVGLPVANPARSAMELHRLYILSPAQGQGLGHAFMEKVFAEAARRQARELYAGVWENNTKAQAFYRRYGFEKIGEYDYLPIGDVVDREWILRKKLEK
jgi:diamine N-acetyltransferase